ncbi:MAG TPA: hypothetical protein PKY13_10870 [Microthrixaceae bacterium]|jgi:hypothetical protein|nr:hypothetical protein [Microthrixaceae bacterium]HQF96066.1 hypothetical protein [Microthrixaceae bacterium]
MALSPSPRAIARRILGRSQLETVEQLARQQEILQRSDRERLDAIEERVAALTLTLDGVSASVDRLHATIVAADPQMMRSVLESVRADVTQLSADVSSQLARIAQG